MSGQRLEATRWPGVYRRGSRYAYEWTDADGKRRRGSADTAAEAREAKARREQEARDGQRGNVGPRGRFTVARYARELFGADLTRPKDATAARGRYQGRKGAVRDATRVDYRGHMERTWLPILGNRPLAKIAPQDLSRAVAALADRDGGEYLTDATIRRMFAPLSALLACAAEEGLIPHNPAREVRLPSGRDELRRFRDDDGDADDPAPGQARALSRGELEAFLLVVDPRWRAFFELLAATGLRVSEALALRWADLRLGGSRPVVRVRRAYVRGTFGPPKSRHGRRDVPLGFQMVRALRQRRAASEWPGDADLVFPSMAGTAMSDANLRHRTLGPAAEEAGVPWAGSMRSATSAPAPSSPRGATSCRCLGGSATTRRA